MFYSFYRCFMSTIRTGVIKPQHVRNSGHLSLGLNPEQKKKSLKKFKYFFINVFK